MKFRIELGTNSKNVHILYYSFIYLALRRNIRSSSINCQEENLHIVFYQMLQQTGQLQKQLMTHRNQSILRWI
ncbi:hypothetical protein T07_9020, partial [Trichinella nelsoni]